MAIDEAIFLEAGKGNLPPTFRIYGWLRPAVSLGRFQRAEAEIDVAYCRREKIEIVSRPTGGKAVYHENVLTYALICGPNCDIFPESIPDAYAVISRALAEGLSRVGIPVTFGPRQKKEGGAVTSFCFSACAPAELAVGGRKILGSAQVRGRKNFLQHGSLLITCEVERIYQCFLPHRIPREEELEKLKSTIACVSEYVSDLTFIHERIGEAWKEAFSHFFDVSFEEGELTKKEAETAHLLLTMKYVPAQERFLLP